MSILDLIEGIARDLSPETVDALVAKLESLPGRVLPGAVTQIGPTELSRRLLQNLEDTLRASQGPTGPAAALALRATRQAIDHARKEVPEVAWTGPGTGAFPTRRVDQVLYELVGSATKELVVVSYVAYGAERALAALEAATRRGVEVTVVAERAVETSGQLTFDGLSQVREKVPKAHFYFWPMDRRSTTPSGKKGVLHAKCVICDEMSALVSSANLTDYALEQNMELGLVLRGGEVPRQLAAHFRRLIQQGDLVPWL